MSHAWRSLFVCLAWLGGLFAAAQDAGAGADTRGTTVRLRVDAGGLARRDTPVHAEVPAEMLPPAVADALAAGPVGLAFHEVGGPAKPGDAVVVQADRIPGDGPARVRLTWILAGETPASATRVFELDREPLAKLPSPWSFATLPNGQLDLKNRERTVFRYNAAPSSHPNYGKILTRDAYIHPAFTPSGALITGDFSKFHPHHRGFFLAYTKTQVGRLHPDFWNIQGGSGKILCESVEPPSAGPVVARLVTHHRWEAKGTVVLREQWDIQVYDIPGQPYWLFDLTSTQQATGEPLELPPYRYGGMAYRGPEPFVKGPIDVLTSEGSGRRERDQKPARWVDLTGPIEEGSSQYAGALVCDHPDNVNHPTVARIHPTTLPFFSFVPSHDKAVTIPADRPTVFQYRVLIHDGRPDRERDERVWKEFAEPARVTVEASAP